MCLDYSCVHSNLTATRVHAHTRTHPFFALVTWGILASCYLASGWRTKLLAACAMVATRVWLFQPHGLGSKPKQHLILGLGLPSTFPSLSAQSRMLLRHASNGVARMSPPAYRKDSVSCLDRMSDGFEGLGTLEIHALTPERSSTARSRAIKRCPTAFLALPEMQASLALLLSINAERGLFLILFFQRIMAATYAKSSASKIMVFLLAESKVMHPTHSMDRRE